MFSSQATVFHQGVIHVMEIAASAFLPCLAFCWEQPTGSLDFSVNTVLDQGWGRGQGTQCGIAGATVNYASSSKKAE